MECVEFKNAEKLLAYMGTQNISSNRHHLALAIKPMAIVEPLPEPELIGNIDLRYVVILLLYIY